MEVVMRPKLEIFPVWQVRLVMREVLSRLIGSSFKSGAVLKRLEVGDQRRHDFWLETMKVNIGQIGDQ